MWTDLSSVLSQCTRVTDGQTDRQTDRILIANNNTKKKKKKKKMKKKRNIMTSYNNGRH